MVSCRSADQPGIATIYAMPEVGNLSGHNCNKSPWIPGLWYKAARKSSGELRLKQHYSLNVAARRQLDQATLVHLARNSRVAAAMPGAARACLLATGHDWPPLKRCEPSPRVAIKMPKCPCACTLVSRHGSLYASKRCSPCLPANLVGSTGAYYTQFSSYGC